MLYGGGATEGFAHPLPHAARREAIRQGRERPAPVGADLQVSCESNYSSARPAWLASRLASRPVSTSILR